MDKSAEFKKILHSLVMGDHRKIAAHAALLADLKNAIPVYLMPKYDAFQRVLGDENIASIFIDANANRCTHEEAMAKAREKLAKMHFKETWIKEIPDDIAYALNWVQDSEDAPDPPAPPLTIDDWILNAISDYNALSESDEQGCLNFIGTYHAVGIECANRSELEQNTDAIPRFASCLQGPSQADLWALKYEGNNEKYFLLPRKGLLYDQSTHEYSSLKTFFNSEFSVGKAYRKIKAIQMAVFTYQNNRWDCTEKGELELLEASVDSAAIQQKISKTTNDWLDNMKNQALKAISKAKEAVPSLQGDEDWQCVCGKTNSGKNNFCTACGHPKVNGESPSSVQNNWQCSCGKMNAGKNNFCTVCGRHRPV